MSYEIRYSVSTNDEDFYFLIPNGSPLLFRAIKTSPNNYTLYWVDNNGMVEKTTTTSYLVKIVMSYVKRKLWIKQEYIPETILTNV